MDTHDPTQWYLIATLAVLYSIYATGRFLADGQPGWWPVANVVARYILSFGLLHNLPAPPPHTVPITTTLVLAVLAAPKAVRHIARRHHHTRWANPPDVERIPSRTRIINQHKEFPPMNTNPTMPAPPADTPDDDSWSHTEDKAIPATVTVEPTASNAYGPPIFLSIRRGDTTSGIWLDLDTWEEMYQAGIAAHDVRVELTQQGWT